jgi:hypothetical protein
MSAAVVKLDPGKPGSVPNDPPKLTAPLVLEQRFMKELELEAGKGRIGAVAYAAVTGGKPAADALAALHGQIQAAEFALACNAAAHSFAVEADQVALDAWWDAVHALPADQAIAGITKTECCRRCGPHGCVITGAECAHPTKVGVLNPRHQGNPDVRRLHVAASKLLGAFR